MATKAEHRLRERTAKGGEEVEEQDKAAGAGTPPLSLPPPPPSSSAAASPSHEFSFTISFQPPLSTSPNTLNLKSSHKAVVASTVDLAPADDIFLHGHLLPLRLLSHPASPPRPSDITFENLSLPLEHVDSARCLKYDGEHLGGDVVELHRHDSAAAASKMMMRARAKEKTLASFFGGLAKLRRRNENGGGGEKEEEEKKKKKKGFEVMTRLLRKYASLMEALLFFKGESKEKRDIRRRPYSFSGHSNRREMQVEVWRRRKGQFSAPASTRTSPTNSGLLSAAASMTFSSSDNSTMEELQSAIQAAIAHCKNSIASKQRGET